MHVKGKVITRKKPCLYPFVPHCIPLMTSQFTPRSAETCKTEEMSLKKSKNIRQNTNKKLGFLYIIPS